jgi:hypothetical protein
MRFHKSFALLAILALSLTTPFMSYAAPKTQPLAALPNLMVQDANHASVTSLAIVNAGLLPSGPFHVRIQLDNGATYYVGLPGLAAGDVQGVQMPIAKDGKPYSFTISVDCDHEVTESDESDNLATVRFIG